MAMQSSFHFAIIASMRLPFFLVLMLLSSRSTQAFVVSRRCAHDYSPRTTYNTAPQSRRQKNRCLPSFSTNNGRKQRSGTTTLLFGVPGDNMKGIELSNLLYDSTSTAFDTWEWTANLGAPAALVAGAVLATMAETREDHVPKKSDGKWVRVLKRLCRLMLFSSFALEVICIFVSTVIGSVLLGHGACAAASVVGYTSPLGLMVHHHEIEYLTIQITFLQGLFNWLLAVAIEFLIQRDNETRSARRMNQALASGVVSLLLWITAFYNHHLNFYSDYASMLRRYAVLWFKTYFPLSLKDFRPMSLLYGPSFLMSGALLWRAFGFPPTDEEGEKNDDKDELVGEK